MGRAIADYWKTKKADRLRVFSPMFEEDEIPLTTLFRTYENMPEIERKALDMATGRTLDVGAASGCHSLVLQKKGIDVTAIDISPLAVETMKNRGVNPSEAVYIGDSDVDIRTGKNAGIDYISVDWGFRTREFLLANGAERIFSKPCELGEYLTGQQA